MPRLRHVSLLRALTNARQAKSALGILLCTLLAMLSPGQPISSSFDPDRDTFAFANETVFTYDPETQPVQASTIPYSRRCFVMTRAALQFHRHADFQPEHPRLSRSEYRDLVAKVVRRPAWRPCLASESRIVIPGFRDLRHFSIAFPGLLQEMLGAGLPTYFRIANWRIMFPFTPSGQTATARRLSRILQTGSPQIIFVNEGFDLNHALVVHAVRQEGLDSYSFSYYDPNLPDARPLLQFEEGRFILPQTFYFDGGPANVYLIYTHPFD